MQRGEEGTAVEKRSTKRKGLQEALGKLKDSLKDNWGSWSEGLCVCMCIASCFVSH